jgi:glycine betaine/proline transport system ATP-binding protein
LSLVEVKNVYKVFGGKADEAVKMLEAGESREEVAEATNTVPAVIDASFEIERGEIFVVMGLSGSGKSTLVRCLNLMHPPTSGSVKVDGRELESLDAAELRALRAEKISMVFQHFGLFPHRTVLDNAAWGLEVRKVPDEERRKKAAEALELVGLGGWGDSYPGELSGGMQQRVGLARALATDADVLLMDEAFSALDPLIRSEMQEQLVGLQRDLEKTVIFITHDLNEAMFLGDRIAIMKDGRIVQIGTTEEILQDPADDYVRAFVQDVDRSRVLTAEAVMEEPVAKILRREGPKAALLEMKARQTTGLLIVDERKRLVGGTTDDAVVKAVRSGQHQLEPVISREEIATVTPETPLVDLLIPSAENRLPLAVVDEHDRLLGVIPRITLLNALGGTDNGDADSDEDEITAAEPTDAQNAEASTPPSGDEGEGVRS